MQVLTGELPELTILSLYKNKKANYKINISYYFYK